jgi:hypothetical protein
MLTELDFNSWRFNREAVHFNGGREFFGYGHQCVDQPRLLVVDKYFRKDRRQERSYTVDGSRNFTTLAGALAALDRPPEVTDEHRELLRRLPPDEAVRLEGRLPYVELGYMGLVAWGRDDENKVTCRITDAGRAAITEA